MHPMISLSQISHSSLLSFSKEGLHIIKISSIIMSMYIFFWNCHRALFLRLQGHIIMKNFLLLLSMFYLHFYQSEYILIPCCQSINILGVKIQTIFEIEVKLWNESLHFVCLVYNVYLSLYINNPMYLSSSQSNHNT